MTADVITLDGVTSVEDLFTTLSSDARVAQALLRSEVVELARALGLHVPRKRFTERELVAQSRKRWKAQLPPRPCSGCVLTGRRWYKINSGEPLLMFFNDRALREVLPESSAAVDDALSLISAEFPQVKMRTARLGETPDVSFTALPMDGRMGTLGVTTTFSVPDTEDLDLGGDLWESAQVTFDTSELWDYGFFVTVFLHEFLHVLGLDHAPSTVDDIMRSFYAGARRTFGPWTAQEMASRYITGVLSA